MKTESLELRLQPVEKAAFRDAANLSGLALSAWARMQLRKAAIREFEEAGKRLDLSVLEGK
jgi:uncharacterized protein (DUF1778 family)